MTDIQSLIRSNIRSLIPYSSARSEYKGTEAILLDANENPYNYPYNRYPDPLQTRLKNRISEIKAVAAEKIFLGNGSDEAIDLLIRAFCEPGTDNIVSIKPTYGMYKVCADINNIEYRDVLLTPGFQPDIEKLIHIADKNSKLLFLCTPNNPTSNSLKRDNILQLVKSFAGIVVVDEAYIDFSQEVSLLADLPKYKNLVVLQTFSKAWGMAGIRLGMAFAHEEIINVLNSIKYPYNINILTQHTALDRLTNTTDKDKWIKTILSERQKLVNKLSVMPLVKDIMPSDANFLMVKFDRPREVYEYLTGRKIIVRDRSRVEMCTGYLRFTIGSESENILLLEALNAFSNRKD